MKQTIDEFRRATAHHPLENQISKNYAVQVNAKELKTSARRAEVARLILAGFTKDEIISWLQETFAFSFKEAYTNYKQGFTYIYLQCEEEKDELRKVQLARLEQLYDRAEKECSEMTKKDFFKTQMSNIDLTAKVGGLYDDRKTEEPDSTDISFNLKVNEKKDKNNKR